jgi:ABC-type glycerol-3-phosphate transport system permease component
MVEAMKKGATMINSNKIKRTIGNVLFGIAIVAIVMFCMFPFLQIISVSLKDVQDLSLIHLSEPTRPLYI